MSLLKLDGDWQNEINWLEFSAVQVLTTRSLQEITSCVLIIPNDLDFDP